MLSTAGHNSSASSHAALALFTKCVSFFLVVLSPNALFNYGKVESAAQERKTLLGLGHAVVSVMKRSAVYLTTKGMNGFQNR